MTAIFIRIMTIPASSAGFTDALKDPDHKIISDPGLLF